jgi:hypothetical protein
MAPAPSTEGSNAPLADYFFISGIESSQVYEERLQPNGIVSPLASPPVDETIEEDRALETDSIRPTSQDGLPNGGSTRRRSGQRLSENRLSVGTITGLEPSKTTVTPSNRSSATVKGLNAGGGLSDVDFENALRKFASERDTFLEEIQFTAGVAQQSRQTPTRPRPRPPRVSQAPSTNGEDGIASLRSGVGSIRRRLSTMQSSMKRQPSTARQCKCSSYSLCDTTHVKTWIVCFFDRPLLTPHSLDTNIQTHVRLQFGHPSATAV